MVTCNGPWIARTSFRKNERTLPESLEAQLSDMRPGGKAQRHQLLVRKRMAAGVLSRVANFFFRNQLDDGCGQGLLWVNTEDSYNRAAHTHTHTRQTTARGIRVTSSGLKFDSHSDCSFFYKSKEAPH